MNSCLHIKHTAVLATLDLTLLPMLPAQTAPDFRKPPSAEWPLVGGDWGNDVKHLTGAKSNVALPHLLY